MRKKLIPQELVAQSGGAVLRNKLPFRQRAGETTMNRRHYTIMTIDDHRAAAREWAIVHRSVAEFGNAIFEILKDRRRAGQPSKALCGRIPRTLKRIHTALDKIQIGMRELQIRTLPDVAESVACWLENAALEPAAIVQEVTGVLELDRHITAAKALGPAQPAVRRFLNIISLRRHLPVRMMDDALRVLHLIQFLRCQMEDLQFYSLRGRGIPWVNCWLGRNNYVDGGKVGNTDMDNTPLEVN
jgi:hypothetical protein